MEAVVEAVGGVELVEAGVLAVLCVVSLADKAAFAVCVAVCAFFNFTPRAIEVASAAVKFALAFRSAALLLASREL